MTSNRAQTTIVAMWSGPRNLSTALMRSFAQRSDTKAWDEPFYAAYLAATGIEHPMREEIIADGITEPAKVIEACLTPPDPPLSVFYQKHMTHHMIDGFDTGWIGQARNAFLLRAPERVLASYARKREAVSAAEIGYAMQRRLFDEAVGLDRHPPIVIESDDIRRNPRAALQLLCGALGIEFDPAMLSWPSGPAPEDGIWGRHWYDAIWKSTGFAPPESGLPRLSGELAAIADEVRADYEYLHAKRLIVPDE